MPPVDNLEAPTSPARSGGGTHHSTRHFAAALILSAAILGACASAAPPAGSPPPPTTAPAATAAASTPSFTAAQAQLGQRVFGTACAACHSTAEFSGRMFEMAWMGRTVGDFFEFVRATMPQDRPGGLSPAEYASVVAYLMQINGHAAGTTELPADAGALAGMNWR